MESKKKTKVNYRKQRTKYFAKKSKDFKDVKLIPEKKYFKTIGSDI